MQQPKRAADAKLTEGSCRRLLDGTAGTDANWPASIPGVAPWQSSAPYLREDVTRAWLLAVTSAPAVYDWAEARRRANRGRSGRRDRAPLGALSGCDAYHRLMGIPLRVLLGAVGPNPVEALGVSRFGRPATCPI